MEDAVQTGRPGWRSRRCGAAVAGLRQLRHVPQLSASLRSLRRGGEATSRTRPGSHADDCGQLPQVRPRRRGCGSAYRRAPRAGRPAGTGRRRTPAYKPSLLRSLTRDALDTGVQDFDAGLLWARASCCCSGLVMVYSASIAVPEQKRNHQRRCVDLLPRPPFVSMCIAGLAAGGLAFAVPVSGWQRAALPLFLLWHVMLALVFVPGIGRRPAAPTAGDQPRRR